MSTASRERSKGKKKRSVNVRMCVSSIDPSGSPINRNVGDIIKLGSGSCSKLYG